MLAKIYVVIHHMQIVVQKQATQAHSESHKRNRRLEQCQQQE
jgi:hypothetical protein